MKVLRNCRQILTLHSAAQKGGRNLRPKDLGVIHGGAIAFDGDSILWAGEEQNLPAEYQQAEAMDAQGLIVTPELVDSHTHAVFGGERSDEYALRLNGADYQEIADAGGGILNSSKQTASLTEEELFELARARVERIHSLGVGTLEIKSGYGLNYEVEKRLTHVIDRLKNHFAPRVQIFNTFMAAHAVPAEFKSSRDYLDEVVLPLLNELFPQGKIDFVDIFHEVGNFTQEDVRHLFDHCQKLAVPTKIHADEFHDNGGAKLAVEYQSRSADHLLNVSQEGILALAGSASTVATVLPGTGFFLGKRAAPTRRLLDAGAQVAIASDYNPGSCHCDNLLLLASIAAPLYQMNQAELWAAITLNAAKALGLTNQGSIRPNFAARFSFFQARSINEITYSWGKNFARTL